MYAGAGVVVGAGAGVVIGAGDEGTELAQEALTLKSNAMVMTMDRSRFIP